VGLLLKILLLYEKSVEIDLVNHVAFVLKDALNAQVIDEEAVVIPDTLYDSKRGQYLAEFIVEYASNFSKEDVYVMLLSSRDAYIMGLNFVFGLAIPWLKTAAVFLARLAMGATKMTLLSRVEKEVLHELGHLLGLEHCKTPRCVMNFSNSLRDVDVKTSKFCEKCYTKLYRGGIVVAEEYTMRNTA
jgi:archaemetzincin